MEILWTFSIYLESVAILPQLFMVQKTGEAESITSHYLFALGSYRGLYILNWIYRYYFEGKHVWIFAEKYLVVYTQNNIISSLYLRRCSPEKFCAKQMVLKNVNRTNWGIQKSKVQNNIMCLLEDSSWYKQPILSKFGGFFGLCCTSHLKGHMIWFCTLLFCIPQ